MKRLLLTSITLYFLSTSILSAQSCQAYYQFTTGLCPEIVFSDASTIDPTDQIVSYNWTYGDGEFDNGQTVNHTYQANGQYIACLTIVTLNGCTDTYCDTVEINCILQANCQAMFQQSTAACPDVQFTDASFSSGTTVSWSYDFGDGSMSTSASPSHTYATNGMYQACLTIETDEACSSTFCDSVEIDCIANVNEIGKNQFRVSPNPATDEISVTLDPNSIFSYRILGINGKQYTSGQVISDQARYSFDIRSLDKGMYLIEIELGGVTSITRFIKR